MVCGSGNAYCASARISGSRIFNSKQCDMPNINSKTMMLLEDIKVKNGNMESTARTLWDNGSSRVLVRHSYAKRMKFRACRVSYRLSVVGGDLDTVKDGVIYEFTVVDNFGQKHNLWGYGIDHIIDPPEAVDLRPVRRLFPHVPDNVFDALPSKPVDLLIGINYFALHPDGGQGLNCVDNLRVLHSNFSKGWLVAGSHPDLKFKSPKWSSSALSVARICRLDVRPVIDLKSGCSNKPQYSKDFWESEMMGVLPPKRCCKCLSCPDCTDNALILSRKDQDELEMMQKSIKLENGQLIVSYPFIRSPEGFPNNRDKAISMAIKQEARLKKKGLLDKYNVELYKYITRGIVVPISAEEIAEYKGPCNYISHHAVEKASPTTPFRIVTNSSLKNGVRSLNECLPKGPNGLNSMLDILVRFRCYKVALVFDLSKAYNSLLTGITEKHLRRLIWRFDPNEEWQDFGFVVVAFGDKPAGEFLELGKGLCADAGKNIDPDAAERIKRDSYVDDHVTGGSEAEVRRMRGDHLADGSYTGTISRILGLGNLKVKVMVTSGETDVSAKETLGDKVLGYYWDPTPDLMAVLFPINTYGRSRKTKKGPDVSKDSLDSLMDTEFTKKVCLGIVNGVTDLLGIACPFLLRFKLLMKQIFEDKTVSWNDQIGEDAKLAWINLIREAVMSESLVFPRCTRPAGAVGAPMIISFSDGSFDAFATAVYIRWKMPGQNEANDEVFHVQLLCAKSRVTPISGLTIPRSELSALLLSTRLILTAVKALSMVEEMQPDEAILLSDSECCISALDKSTSALKPYFHNRVSEIVSNLKSLDAFCKVEKVSHVPREFNAADIATHSGAKLCDLGPTSAWQKGPSFLSLRRDSWPIGRDFVRTDLPDTELRTKCMNVFAALRLVCCSSKVKDLMLIPVWSSIVSTLNYSNSLQKVMNILVRITRGWKLHGTVDKLSRNDPKVLEMIAAPPNPNELETAERLVLLSAMPATYSAYVDGKLDSLLPKYEGNIIVTSGRLGEKSLSSLLGKSALPILMPSSRAAYLYMVRAHCGDMDMVHKSAVETLARTRHFVWIVRGKQLAKTVCKNCPLCIRLRQETMVQQIAELKPESVQICKPWTFVSLDFTGPIICKGVVNSRARRKCWILVYVCRNTKAVCLLATAGYDTPTFLLRHDEFVARFGAPREIVTDQGTQLIAAGEILSKKAETPASWDWSKVAELNTTTVWKHVPAGSQHHNGLPESMVKALKKSLAQTLHPGVIPTYDELVTLLARVSCSLNSRPLALSSVSGSDEQEDNLMVITPNHMLLGRSSTSSLPMDYDPEDKFCQRVNFVAALEQDWWERWLKTVMPSLLPARKWKKQMKNLAIGDVVLVIFPGKVKDSRALGIVTKVYPDGRGLVRKVTVRFRRKNVREAFNVCRSKMEEKDVAVQRLVLLVSSRQQSLL